jgi:hypothetical protein
VATTQEKRKANRARRLIRSESRWLQKAIFALAKAEDARGKLADLTEDDTYAFHVELDGTEHDVALVSTALREVVEDRLQERRVELRERMKLR